MNVAETIVLFALLGFLAGAIHFTLLRQNVGMLVSGGSIAGAVAAITGRFAVTVLIFLMVAMFHGLAVLWTLGGFVLARMAAVRVIQPGT